MQPNNIKPKKNNQQEQHTIILDYPWEQKNGIWLNDSPSKYYTFPDKSHPKNIISNTQSKAHNQSKK